MWRAVWMFFVTSFTLNYGKCISDEVVLRQRYYLSVFLSKMIGESDHKISDDKNQLLS